MPKLIFQTGADAQEFELTARELRLASAIYVAYAKTTEGITYKPGGDLVIELPTPEDDCDPATMTADAVRWAMQALELT